MAAILLPPSTGSGHLATSRLARPRDHVQVLTDTRPRHAFRPPWHPGTTRATRPRQCGARILLEGDELICVRDWPVPPPARRLRELVSSVVYAHPVHSGHSDVFAPMLVYPGAKRQPSIGCECIQPSACQSAACQLVRLEMEPQTLFLSLFLRASFAFHAYTLSRLTTSSTAVWTLLGLLLC